MPRSLLALFASLLAVCAVALAGPAGHKLSSPSVAEAAAQQRAAPRLTVAAATTPIRQFLASATQVAALPRSFTVGHCARRSPRVLDCVIAIPGRTRGTMRAKLIGTTHPRVQLYMLRVAAT